MIKTDEIMNEELLLNLEYQGYDLIIDVISLTNSSEWDYIYASYESMREEEYEDEKYEEEKQKEQEARLYIQIDMDKYLITDPAFICGILKIPNDILTDEKKLKLMSGEIFEKTEKLKIVQDWLGDEERLTLMLNNEKYVRLSKELVDKGIKTIESWEGMKIAKADIEWLICGKDSPIIMYYKNFGILIAPRVESDD